MPIYSLPFLGEAGKTYLQELLLAVRFPEAACVGVAVEGQLQLHNWPMVLSNTMLRPTVLGQGDPSFGTKQESLRVGAFGIASLDGIPRE